MAKIAVLIVAPTGSRLLATTCEREAALMAESVLAGIVAEALPVPVWVHCADAAVGARLAAYLSAVQDDLTRDAATWSCRGRARPGHPMG